MHLEHPPPCPPSCTHCLAYDNITRALCSRIPSHNSKWCKVHEELQAKLLKSYKRLTIAFEAHDDSVLPASVDAIFAQQDLPQLRRWSEASRAKWSLARRVIVARAEHHAQFYAGGDWGHCLFVETVRTESARMERFLRALDRQAYAVTLAQSQASWVLDIPAGPSFICNDGPAATKGGEDDAPLTPPPTPPLANRSLPKTKSKQAASKVQHKRDKKGGKSAGSLKTQSTPTPPLSGGTGSPTGSSDDLDDFFATLSCSPVAPPNARDLIAQLRGYLEPPSDLPLSISGKTWTAFVEVLIRHVVLRVPSLANLALTGAYSMAPLLNDPSATSLRSDELAPLEKPASVQAFLDVLESRLTPAFVPDDLAAPAGGGDRDVELLWRALKFARGPTASESKEGKGKGKEPAEDGLLGVGVLADAIDNVYRGLNNDEDGEDAYVGVLGGQVWKTQKKAPEWPREAWDLFYQLIACGGCSLIATRSLAAWTSNRRLAALGHYPAWLAPGETTAERVFRLCSIVLCTSNSCHAGRKVKRVEQKDTAGKKTKGGKGKKTVYIEEMERGWMYIKLPLDDPRSSVILDHLSTLPERFSILARRTVDDEITHSPSEPGESCAAGRGCICCSESDLWLNRVRSGLTPVERKAARWTTTTYFPRDSVLSSLLKSSSPELRFQDTPFADSLDAVILDATPLTSSTHDKWTNFADSVAEAVLQARDCATIGELIFREKSAAAECGDMGEREWEEVHACAADGDRGPTGRSGSKKVVYVCEEGLTARNIFREE
ncbi:uncharacterized protein JCM10292_003919 [Rhodotorula paludigena]|uniref:uncharacterized protein n=1 Tax=Rhodotorula paludigena TaxID=86838 RepID=UPI00317EA769